LEILGVVDIDRDIALATHARQTEIHTYLNKSAIEASHLAVKSLFLINGGSAVAMLAFLANIIKIDLPVQLGEVSNAQLWFATGVAASTICAMMSYIVTYCHVSAVTETSLTWEHPFVSESSAAKKWNIAANIFHILAIFFAFVSLASFVLGIVSVQSGFVALIS
jgi:hypothetical protein